MVWPSRYGARVCLLEPIAELIAQTDGNNIIRNDLFDFAPLRSWAKGRVVLIGDAAHAAMPNLEQGGAQAIEDSWVLSEVLATSKIASLRPTKFASNGFPEFTTL